MPTGLHSHLIIKAIKLVIKLKVFKMKLNVKLLEVTRVAQVTSKFTCSLYSHIGKKKTKKTQGAHGHITITLPTIHIIQSALWI